MTDVDELERKALAACDGGRGKWSVSRSDGSIISTDKTCGHERTVAFARLIDELPGRLSLELSIDSCDAEYIEASQPSVMLELIAEIRRLRAGSQR